MISSFDEFVRDPTYNSAPRVRGSVLLSTYLPLVRSLFSCSSHLLELVYIQKIKKHLGISNIWIRNHLSLLTALLEMNTIWPWMTFDNTAQISNAKTEGRKDLQSCNIIGEAVNGTGSWEIHWKYNFKSITFRFWIVLAYFISIKIVIDMKFSITWSEKCMPVPTTPILASRWVKLEMLVNLLVQIWRHTPLS